MRECNTSDAEYFYSVGISYKKADESLRGKYAFLPQLVTRLVEQAKRNGVHRFFAVSTCNRTELYAFADSPSSLFKIWCDCVGGQQQELLSLASVRKDFEAINHLFRVGAGLESQIVGDFEIIGQIKKWFCLFKKQGTTDAFLERLANTTIQISKKIKHHTTLSSGLTSVAYAAVNYILTRSKNTSSKNITLVGTGKIGRNTCENLFKHTSFKQVTLINRTREKAENLATKFEVTLKDYDSLEEQIHISDVIIVATGAPQPTLRQEHVKTNRPLLIIDLSMPANVDRSLKELPNITLVGIDELSTIIGRNIEKRSEQIPLAEEIIESLEKEFKDWLETRKFAPYIQAFRERLEDIHCVEHGSLKKKNALPANDDRLAEKVIQKLTNHLAAHLLNDKENAEQTIKLINKVFKVPH